MIHKSQEIPVRSKTEMLYDIIKVIHFLHEGDRKAAEPLIRNLKVRAMYLDEQIQQDVLIFSEQVQFQYNYDPWHKISQEVRKAADKLIYDLGFLHLVEAS